MFHISLLQIWTQKKDGEFNVTVGNGYMLKDFPYN